MRSESARDRTTEPGRMSRKKMMKALSIVLLSLLAFALVAALGSWWLGLWGKGSYATNFERGVYDREKPFVAPTLVKDGLAIYLVGEGEPILLLPYPHALHRKLARRPMAWSG
jgi:hypothetical protein